MTWTYCIHLDGEMDGRIDDLITWTQDGLYTKEYDSVFMVAVGSS